MRILLCLMSALAVAGCATTYSLSPVPLTVENQEIRYVRGVPSVTSFGASGAVEVAPASHSFDDRLSFVVVAFNGTETPLTLGTENVSIRYADETARVFTFDELEQEARRQAAWEAFAVALGSAAQSYSNAQAGYSTTTTTYSGTTTGTAFNRFGTTQVQANTMGTAFSQTYNPQVVQQLEAENRAQAQQQMAMIGDRLSTALSALGQNILRTTTIEPGQLFGGQVVGAKPRIRDNQLPVTVEVEFAGETHSFEFFASAN
ncbi:hypothetical protein FLX56_11115 [Synechococcus moorigangaii CMS01]|nr:hypothetical protein [Synechococcus moorigangaii CMS01]